MKVSSMKVFGLSHIHENTSIRFESDGISLSVGLNISPELIPILSHDFKGKVFKGEFIHSYKRAKKIEGIFVSNTTITYVQKILMAEVQKDIKSAKLLIIITKNN
jgi:hypothetical protein